MKITLNGQPCDIEEPRLSDALVELGYAQKLVATAVNGTFVPAGERPTTTLNENDRLEVVAPMQGG